MYIISKDTPKKDIMKTLTSSRIYKWTENDIKHTCDKPKFWVTWIISYPSIDINIFHYFSSPIKRTGTSRDQGYIDDFLCKNHVKKIADHYK